MNEHPKKHVVDIETNWIGIHGIGAPCHAHIKIGRRLKSLRGIAKATEGIANVPATYEGRCRIQAYGGGRILITPLDD